MILFLHGEDSYRSLHKLQKIKERFLLSPGAPSNFTEFEVGEGDISNIVQAIQSTPFLSKKRLVVLKNLLGKGNKAFKDEIEQIVSSDKVPESTILVFYERGKADKRTVLYRTLSKSKHAEEFQPLEGVQLANWIKSEVARLGGKIQSTAIEMMIVNCGNDLWQIANEISKLVSYKNKEIIIDEDVKKMVTKKFDDNIFNLVDAIGAKNPKLALRFLDEQIENGADANYLLAMIIYQFRNLVMVKLMEDEGIPKNSMASTAKLHPYVVRKTLAQANRFSMGGARKIYFKLLETDVELKSGARGDARTIISTLVIDLCS